jgi:hypothetical protein
MLLEWVDFYGLLLLAPFLVLAAVTLGVFGFTFAVGRAWTYYLHPLDAALFTTCAVIAFYPCSGLPPRRARWLQRSWPSTPRSSTPTSAPRTGSAT